MDENQELNDIILNKSDSKSNNNKILLAIATLSILLIIVVVTMNQINNPGTGNLPKAALPSEKPDLINVEKDDPLFEPVTVIEEEISEKDAVAKSDLDQVVKQIKQKSKPAYAEPDIAEAPMEVILHRDGDELRIEVDQMEQVPRIEKPVKVKTAPKSKAVKPKKVSKKAVVSGSMYIQVGSFSKYTPNKKFLRTITDNGYTYSYHRVVRNGKIINKVLIGPFANRAEAKTALVKVRKNIEPTAFILSSLK